MTISRLFDFTFAHSHFDGLHEDERNMRVLSCFAARSKVTLGMRLLDSQFLPQTVGGHCP
jgi:hypothetical protein